ncbi:arginine--tRNA ligase [Paenibacillus thermoaerophilus]|uniref:Arginine--tRNA ligase n=1 Tax=Paenibacillus thermoaerophilus TaxID=1215385 RepID=A0ABW2V2A9_9BACL|nr:arginine--tRNA ligase [Paenibacillus thermoaerophilus]TMV18890.1 arginine--tRNA ligase [Paenibacillus thermoaerophilus]
MNYKAVVAELVAAKLPELNAETVAELLEYPPNPELGDLSLPCFKLSKQLRQAPQQIASRIAEQLDPHPAIASVEAVSGYLNFKLDRARFAADVLGAVLREGERYGSRTIGAGKTIVIDYSSPNIAKPFHIGHLRSTMIGNALYKIHEFLGYTCVGVNHLGDWGTQFGKQIAAFKLWGDADKVEREGVEELLRLYVKFHEEAEKNPALEDEARALFVKLEQGDEECLRLWKWIIEISYREFNKIYGLLNVTFDSDLGESFYIDKTGAVIEELEAKNLLVEDDGAKLVRLDEYNMPPVLIVKKDGATLYHTRDIAAAFYRKKTYDFHKCIYVTGSAQSLHFAQWFKIIELMGYDWAADLVHVPFGQVSLEGAKLSTRKGNVVLLEELLQKSIDQTLQIISEKNPSLENKDEVARQVGVGAIVFNDLSTYRIKDVVFSWDEVLNFEGETGPYVQYAHARCCSVLRKASGTDSIEAPAVTPEQAALLTHPSEQAALRELYLFPERVLQAQQKLEPSIITRHLVDVAQSFSRFYHDCPILVDDEGQRAARLGLVKAVQTVLKTGLALIGLEAPQKM